MYCSKCGAQLPDDATFCFNCGQSQSAATQQAYQPQIRQNQYQQPSNALEQPNGRVKTVADKVIMIILMVFTLGGALLPFAPWAVIPLNSDITSFLGSADYAGPVNVFGVIGFLDRLLKTLGDTLISANMDPTGIEMLWLVVIFMRVIAVMMVISMVLSFVMIILGLCFQYKPSCVFSMISAVTMFISSISYTIFLVIFSMTNLYTESDMFATMTLIPVLAILVSLVNVVLTIVAMVLTTRARNKKLAAKSGRLL